MSTPVQVDASDMPIATTDIHSPASTRVPPTILGTFPVGCGTASAAMSNRSSNGDETGTRWRWCQILAKSWRPIGPSRMGSGATTRQRILERAQRDRNGPPEVTRVMRVFVGPRGGGGRGKDEDGAVSRLEVSKAEIGRAHV